MVDIHIYHKKQNYFNKHFSDKVCSFLQQSSLWKNCDIVSAWVLILASQPQPSNFFKSLSGTQKALIIPICCTCLTTTLIMTSEQPTNTS